MKLVWLSTVALALSVNAYAKCPAGTQGSNDWNEAVAAADRTLHQKVRDGATATEKDTDGRPVRIQFINAGDKVAVNLFRSSGNGKLYDIKTYTRASTEVCSGGGTLTLLIKGTVTNPGATVQISSGGGSALTVVASNYMGSMTLNFGPVVGGTEVATDRGNGR